MDFNIRRPSNQGFELMKTDDKIKSSRSYIFWDSFTPYKMLAGGEGWRLSAFSAVACSE
jgi:hypothetical protein